MGHVREPNGFPLKKGGQGVVEMGINAIVGAKAYFLFKEFK
jgi:hypothetical protein